MTATDRELLERAAKAAGIEALRLDAHPQHASHWDPLADDGDALRLAVKLGLGVIQWGDEMVSATHATTNREFSETYDADPFAATRRAIVRAAAAMAGEGE